MRRQFKVDNEQMHIDTIFNVYVQKESGDVYHHVSQPFGMLDRESQELFFVNFKKVLTGQLDAKLFELTFDKEVEENSTQGILFESRRADDPEDWQDDMLEMVDKMFTHTQYDFDTVVTFIRGQYHQPVKKNHPGFGEEETDTAYANAFILCSVNRTTLPKNALTFDYIEKEFKASTEVDPIINLTTPLTGFLFPTFTDNAADVNRLLYNCGKVNQPNESFIEEVLNCTDISTAAEDKDIFQLIVSKVAGDRVHSDVVSNIYEEIDKIVQESEDEEDEEAPSLNYRDIGTILTTSGVENVEPSAVKEAFKTVIADEQHTFKADNLIPKAVKINTEVANLSLSPKDLKNVKYIMHNGKRCLLLEIDEDVEIEGFQLESSPFY